MGLAILIGSACNQIHSSKSAELGNTTGRTAKIIFLQKYSTDDSERDNKNEDDNHYEKNSDFYHYRFHSPVCPDEWKEGTALGETTLTFSANCPEKIPLEGIVVSHSSECQPTTYFIIKNTAELVVQAVLPGKSIPDSYVPINCRRE